MKKIIVVGGGLAGLTTACLLSKEGYKIELLEASPKLGGRASSFNYEKKDQFVDNGQHLMMGCYRYTLKFFEMIGATRNLERISPMKITFVENGGRQIELDASSGFYPFNLLMALLKYSALPVGKRYKLLFPFASLFYPSAKKNITVDQWLRSEGQDEEEISKFWRILVESILNTSPENASVKSFKKVLLEIFFKGKKASDLVLAKTDLTYTYVHFARDFIERNNGKVYTSERVQQVVNDGKHIQSLLTNKRKIDDFDHVVFAIPSYGVDKLFPNTFGNQLNSLVYPSILTLHIWLKNNPFEEKVYGFIDSKMHWLFNHGTHVSVVISNSDKLLDIEREKLTRQIFSELREYFPLFYEDIIDDYKLVIEKRAAFAATLASDKIRAKFSNPFRNSTFAGDWVNTGLPSTMEGAVKSGFMAAKQILEKI